MKKKIHPEYKKVLFYDISSNKKFIISSTIKSKENIKYKKKIYPLIKIEISSKSHPFYTKKNKILDSTGQIEKFKNKFNKFLY